MCLKMTTENTKIGRRWRGRNARVEENGGLLVDCVTMRAREDDCRGGCDMPGARACSPRDENRDKTFAFSNQLYRSYAENRCAAGQQY